MSTSEDKDKAGTGTGADEGASSTSSTRSAQDSAGASKAGASKVGATKAGASKVGANQVSDAAKAKSDKAADDIAKGKQPQETKTTRRGDRPEKVPGGPSSTLFKVVMLGLMVVGLIWIVIFYLANGDAPIPGIRYGNLAIGFGLIMAGFVMTTRWR